MTSAVEVETANGLRRLQVFGVGRVVFEIRERGAGSTGKQAHRMTGAECVHCAMVSEQALGGRQEAVALQIIQARVCARPEGAFLVSKDSGDAVAGK